MPLHYFLVPLATVLIWSGNLIVNKLSAGAIAPGAIALYRWVLALLVMTPFIAPSVWRYRREIAQVWWKLAILGLLGLAMWQGLAYFAAAFTSATNMGIFVPIVPLITLLLSALILRERPSIGALLGGIVALVGLAVLLGHGNPLKVLDLGVGLGDGLMLIACITYACYGVLLRRWTFTIPRWTALYVQASFATLFLVPSFFLGEASPINGQNIWLILYAAIPASIISTYLWMQSIRLLGANRASIFMNLVPVLTASFAISFLGETLALYHIIGGALALAGVALAQTVNKPLPSFKAG